MEPEIALSESEAVLDYDLSNYAARHGGLVAELAGHARRLLREKAAAVAARGNEVLAAKIEDLTAENRKLVGLVQDQDAQTQVAINEAQACMAAQGAEVERLKAEVARLTEELATKQQALVDLGKQVAGSA